MTLVRRSFAALLTAVVLAGCGDDAPAGAGWDEPSAYTYVLYSSCGERLLIGTFRVTVANGAVTGVEALDESAKQVVAIKNPSDPVPTIGQLLKRVDEARAKGAHKADVEYADDGRPASIEIDHEKNAIDDEECYRISEYAV